MKTPFIGFLAAGALVLSTPVFAANASSGAATYKAKCASCHSADGSGQTAIGKNLKIRDLRSDEVQKQSDIELTKVIAGGKGKMPAYGKQLTTAQIEDLIAHIRTLHGSPAK